MDLDEFYKLSSEERAAHYLRQAEAALRAAEAASDSGIKVSNLLMADNWEKLAEHCASLDRHRFTGAPVRRVSDRSRRKPEAP